MQKCVTNDFDLDVPSNWIDRSMISFVSPNSKNQKIHPNVLCAMDVLNSGETLDHYVNRQLKDVFAKIQDFVLLKREKKDLGNRECVEIEFTAKIEGGEIRQTQTFFVSDKKQKRISNIVCTCAENEHEKYSPEFRKIINSIQFKK